MKIKERDAYTPGMDMTPMIDVVFLLIIFFMLVTQFTQQMLHGAILLPVAYQSMVDDPGKRMVVNVDSKGKYFYMGHQYTKEQLQSRIVAYGRRKTMEYRGMELSDMKVMIRADQGTPYKFIQNLYFLFQEATIWKICFATLKERK